MECVLVVVLCSNYQAFSVGPEKAQSNMVRAHIILKVKGARGPVRIPHSVPSPRSALAYYTNTYKQSDGQSWAESVLETRKSNGGRKRRRLGMRWMQEQKLRLQILLQSV